MVRIPEKPVHARLYGTVPAYVVGDAYLAVAEQVQYFPSPRTVAQRGQSVVIFQTNEQVDVTFLRRFALRARTKQYHLARMQGGKAISQPDCL